MPIEEKHNEKQPQLTRPAVDPSRGSDVLPNGGLGCLASAVGASSSLEGRLKPPSGLNPSPRCSTHPWAAERRANSAKERRLLEVLNKP